MKKNLAKKLALSAVTMGVAALSVTTTTYAWFTSNSEASATGIKAETKAADANLLISKDGAAGTWKTSIAFDSNDLKLTPAQYVSGENGGWKALDKSTDAVVLTYTVHFHVDSIPTSGSELVVKLNNMTFGDKATQTFAVAAGEGEANAAGKTVEVGLEDVLALNVAKSADVTGVTFTEANYRYLAEDSTGADAVTYYNNVFGYESTDDNFIKRPETGYTFSDTVLNNGSAANEVKLADIAGNTQAEFAITFTFFMDGWDYQCFNAVGGTSLTAGQFDFELKNKTA